ncbi:hypothetical protein NL676_004233 [Syzygium grande]|nr:hypothetical protein NL676_004233 [Syzygium grande]
MERSAAREGGREADGGGTGVSGFGRWWRGPPRRFSPFPPARPLASHVAATRGGVGPMLSNEERDDVSSWISRKRKSVG